MKRVLLTVALCVAASASFAQKRREYGSEYREGNQP